MDIRSDWKTEKKNIQGETCRSPISDTALPRPELERLNIGWILDKSENPFPMLTARDRGALVLYPNTNISHLG